MVFLHVRCGINISFRIFTPIFFVRDQSKPVNGKAFNSGEYPHPHSESHALFAFSGLKSCLKLALSSAVRAMYSVAFILSPVVKSRPWAEQSRVQV